VFIFSSAFNRSGDFSANLTRIHEEVSQNCRYTLVLTCMYVLTAFEDLYYPHPNNNLKTF